MKGAFLLGLMITGASLCFALSPAASTSGAEISATGEIETGPTGGSTLTLPPGLCRGFNGLSSGACLKRVLPGMIPGFAARASVTVNGEELYAGSRMYQSEYSTFKWTGDVKAYRIDPSNGKVLRKSPLWSAAERLENRDWSTGRLIATHDGNKGVPFRFSQLNNLQKTGLGPDWEANPALSSERLEYLRGNRENEMAEGGPFRSRTSIMADIVHSSPTYQSGVLYVGSNGGMLHALDASNGEELFAYVPNLVFHNLSRLTDPGYRHLFFVDLTPAVRDTGNGTFLVGGLRRGGKGYYCLDVSNPFRLNSEADLARKVMWEYPRSSTPDVERRDVGYSYGAPAIVNSNAGMVALFGNGYGSPNGKAVLFVVDLATGRCIARIDTGAGGGNGLSTPIAVDVNNNRKVDYVYAGDLKGNLWKFDLTSPTASDWGVAYSTGGSPAPLFQARDGQGNPQPITTRPDVMHHCSPMLQGYIVIFGTGKYLTLTDFRDHSTQTIYGIWDYGGDGQISEHLGFFDRNSTRALSNRPESIGLLEQKEIYHGIAGGHPVRVLSDYKPDWSTASPGHAGWFFDLPLTGERVITDPMIRDGKVVVVSSIPHSSPCRNDGVSIVHRMDACAGGRTAASPFDRQPGSPAHGWGMIEIPDPHDEYGEISVVPTGTGFTSMLQAPGILRMPDDTEIKYFAVSEGGAIPLRDAGEKRGVYYWKHVD